MRDGRSSESGDHDLLIRGGLVVDGTGAPPRPADVAVSGGRISEVAEPGRALGAREVLGADGMLVTPGFVDIHTHYDGQVTWDTSLAPSSWHGVTTVVMGNCGVGFAPVRPTDHATLIELMEGVEDIPGAALHEGVPFDWETFPEYLAAIERLDHDIDMAAQVPHGALRLYVMGERGARREPATAEEIGEMGRLVAEAVQAGALGFTTSRTLNHRTSTGDATPTLTAAEEELVGIAEAMGTTGAGVMELISDFPDGLAEFQRLRHMVERSGRPLTISLAQQGSSDAYRGMLALLGAVAAEGLPMKAQVAARPIGALFGLQATFSPFERNPAYAEVADLPFDERLAALVDPAVRARILAAESPADAGRFDDLYLLGDPPDYEQPPERSIGGRARSDGRPAAELAYDAMVADGGTGFLYFPFANYVDGDFEAIREMLLHPQTLVGLGDGGAHVGTICDGSNVTTMLTHWTRDRTRGERLELPWVVHALTRRNAEAVGLLDRGVVAPGYKADLNVIDLDNLTLHAPEMRFDLPAGGKRLLQRVDGYVATIVSGQVIARGGTPTGALPGRLVRGGQPAPM
ncbi:MAG TPA: amidohydrolase family protein [Acidimicrobiales bacterium]|nr:amidohydrolase family protein [Acidimicrobiales bacterium]